MSQRHLGFTLVELALVLVIIGLIVAGVLVGQDMIRAAQLRATARQFEEFNSAALTFRSKYAALPGDISPPRAAQFGFTKIHQGGVGAGDESGMVDGQWAMPFKVMISVLSLESLCFWTDLADAGMIAFPATFYHPACTSLGLTEAQQDPAFPPGKMGYGTQWLVSNNNVRNYFWLADPAGNSLRITIPPVIAYAMDAKLDDGAPLQGSVTATSDAARLDVPAVPAVPAAGVCVSNAANNPYNLSVGADAGACMLQLRARF